MFISQTLLLFEGWSGRLAGPLALLFIRRMGIPRAELGCCSMQQSEHFVGRLMQLVDAGQPPVPVCTAPVP